MNKTTVLFCIIALIAMFSTISAHWVKGYDLSILPTDAKINKYTKVGVNVTGTVGKQDASYKWVRLDYVGGFVDNIKNCYAQVGKNKYEDLPAFNFTKVDQNATVVFTLDPTRPQIMNITKGEPSTILYCDVKFNQQPPVDAWFSFDIATTGATPGVRAGHGYSAYAPRHDYDLRNPLGFDPKNPTNRNKNVLASLFNYKFTTVFETTITDIRKDQCTTALAEMKKIAEKDLIEAAKQFKVTFASTPRVIAGACNPQTAKFQMDVLADELYDAVMRFEATAPDANSAELAASAVSGFYSTKVQSDFEVTATTAKANTVPPTCNTCGGDICNTRCANGQACSIDSDCQSNKCENNKCAKATYSASVNGTNTFYTSATIFVIFAAVVAMLF